MTNIISTIIVCALFLLIGLILGYILGSGGPEEYEDFTHKHETKRSKVISPTYTESIKSPPSVHVVNPKSPQVVEFERRNKKPDLIKPE
jgi:hypothetical protein